MFDILGIFILGIMFIGFIIKPNFINTDNPYKLPPRIWFIAVSKIPITIMITTIRIPISLLLNCDNKKEPYDYYIIIYIIFSIFHYIKKVIKIILLIINIINNICFNIFTISYKIIFNTNRLITK